MNTRCTVIRTGRFMTGLFRPGAAPIAGSAMAGEGAAANGSVSTPGYRLTPRPGQGIYFCPDCTLLLR